MVPTSASVGALVTGTGESWSHPHGTAALTDTFCQTAYAASAWADEGTPVTPSAYDFDGAATLINCGSNAALDDLPSQPAGKGTFTAEAWVRADSLGEINLGVIFDKGSAASRGGFLELILPGCGQLSIVQPRMQSLSLVQMILRQMVNCTISPSLGMISLTSVRGCGLMV